MTALVMKKGFGQTTPVSTKEKSKQWKYTFKNKNSLFLKDDTKSRMEESESHYSVMSNSLQPHGLCGPRNSLGQNTGVDSLSLLQGIFPTQGSNPGLPHCGRILYQLSHGEAQEYWSGWVAWSPAAQNQTGVSCIAGGFFTNWANPEWTTTKSHFKCFFFHFFWRKKGFIFKGNCWKPLWILKQKDMGNRKVRSSTKWHHFWLQKMSLGTRWWLYL